MKINHGKHAENKGVHLFDLSDEKFAADHISQYAPDVIIGGPSVSRFFKCWQA